MAKPKKTPPKKIAPKAPKKVLPDFEVDPDDEDGLSEEEEFDDEGEEEEEAEDTGEPASAAPDDLFDHIGPAFAKKGVPVYYDIYLNNVKLGSKNHPYSWNQLQKEFGGGFFRVQLKNGTTHRIMKTQSLQMADPSGWSPRNAGNQPSPIPAQPTNELGTRDVLAMLEQQRQGNEDKARERLREQESSQSSLVQLMMQQQSQSQQMMLTLISEMNKNTAQMMQQIQLQIASSQGSPKRDNSMELATTMLTLYQNAQKVGAESERAHNDRLLEEREGREEIMAEVEKLKAGNSGGSVDRLIEAFVPVIGEIAKKTAEGKAQAPALPEPVLRPRAIQAPPPVRPAAAAVVVNGHSPAPKEIPVAKVEKALSVKDTIQKLLMGKIVMGAQLKRDPAKVARDIEQTLIKNKIAKADLFKHYPLAELLAGARQNNFGPAIEDWLKRLYAELGGTPVEQAPHAPS